METRKLKIQGDLQFRAAFESATFDAERGTVEVIFTTGARGKRYSWEGPYFEELEVSDEAVDLSRLNNGAPVLNTHGSWDLDDVIGVVERAWIDGKQGRALLRFSDRDEVKPIKADVQSGILRHVSVGYTVSKVEKVEEVDDVPVYRVTRWQPMEISVVPMGFDDRAVVRSAEPEKFHEVEVEENEMGENTQTRSAGEQAPAPVVENAEVVKAAQEAERARGIEIRKIVKVAKLGEPMADNLIARGVSVDEARKIVLDKLATEDEQHPTRSHVPVTERGEDDSDKYARGVVASLLERAMVGDRIRKAKKTEIGERLLADVETDGGQFRGWKIETIARECLERRGVRTRGWNPEKILGEAMVRAAQGVDDFPVLLESAMSKTMLASYALEPETWRGFCAVKSVTDFRDTSMFRTGSFGTLDAVSEHGEFKNKAIPDGEKSVISAGTKGNIIAITRKALVNDDLGAFMDLAAKLGAAAARTIESDVYALLTANGGLGPTQSDSQPFFHDNRRNVGTPSALTVDALEADAVLMASQKDPSGNATLDLQPAILLVPRGLRGTAQVLNDAQFDPSVSNKFQVPNKVRGMFATVIGTTRLSGTRRYLLADPGIAPVIAVAFLNGQQAPEMFSEEGWRVDGTEMKVRLDFGVAMVDFRGAVTNAGASQG